MALAPSLSLRAQYKPPTFPKETAYEKRVYAVAEKYIKEGLEGTNKRIKDGDIREVRRAGRIMDVEAILFLVASVYGERHTEEETEDFIESMQDELAAARKLRTPEDDRRDRIRQEALSKAADGTPHEEEPQAGKGKKGKRPKRKLSQKEQERRAKEQELEEATHALKAILGDQVEERPKPKRKRRPKSKRKQKVQ
ncbi:MAG: hypothetical protein CSA07_05435 [Bacteroidia bacterium]|nr:MAG: hypothetical protein CSA07_05435 [Bacteroidia bacterium]